MIVNLPQASIKLKSSKRYSKKIWRKDRTGSQKLRSSGKSALGFEINFKHVTSQLNAAWQAQRSRKQRVSKYLPSFPFNFYTWDNLFADKFAFLFRQQKLLSRIPRRTKAQQNFHFPLESSRLALKTEIGFFVQIFSFRSCSWNKRMHRKICSLVTALLFTN